MIDRLTKQWGGLTRGLVFSPGIRVSIWMFLGLLVLVGCSTITVGPCGKAAVDFASKEEHRSMVIHPRGCYAAWAQEASPFEAERLALLHCTEAHPDSDGECKVVTTDGLICPRSLASWIKAHSENKGVSPATISDMQCKYKAAFEAKSPPGTRPPPVDVRASIARKDVVDFFTLGDFDIGSSETLAYGRTPDSKANWLVTEALHFITKKDRKFTCILRASSGWDPTKHFETVYKVEAVGCFEI